MGRGSEEEEATDAEEAVELAVGRASSRMNFFLERNVPNQWSGSEEPVSSLYV